MTLSVEERAAIIKLRIANAEEALRDADQVSERIDEAKEFIEALKQYLSSKGSAN